MGDDAAHVVDEAHVEHAVGLVEHQHLHRRQVEVALGVVVEQTARCGDDDVHAAAQCVDLRLHADTAVHGHAVQLEVAAVGGEVFMHLSGKFARRGEDEGAGDDLALGVAGGLAAAQALQQGQGEAGGLAGAGLRGGQQVVTGEHHGNGLELDGSGLGVALFGHSAQDGRGQAQILK
ncbi:hypothetical protein GALL_518300 [mine drainage metagenome]|uniref:Uncharacterized protein n=1 Tax=mine drainage metagenome TaxID=410659 RepID=A0A1J5PFJ8_9ZZZZ